MPPKAGRVNAQVTRPQLISLEELAKGEKTSVSDTLRDLIPSPVWTEAIDIVRSLGRMEKQNLTPGQALYVLAARGIQATIADSGLPFKIDPLWLAQVCGSPDNAALTMLAFVHACRHYGKVKMPDGADPEYKFAELPRGGKWEAEGRSGNYVIIAVEDEMSADSIISNPVRV